MVRKARQAMKGRGGNPLPASSLPSHFKYFLNFLYMFASAIEIVTLACAYKFIFNHNNIILIISGIYLEEVTIQFFYLNFT